MTVGVGIHPVLLNTHTHTHAIPPDKKLCISLLQHVDVGLLDTIHEEVMSSPCWSFSASNPTSEMASSPMELSQDLASIVQDTGPNEISLQKSATQLLLESLLVEGVH